MAGSYGHVVNDDGSLMSPSDVIDVLDTPGDVYEAIEQMYGMIWYLAWSIAMEQSGAAADPALYVEGAVDDYKKGLKVSPTKRAMESGYQLKSAVEWGRMLGAVCIDPDGWRHDDGVTLHTPITKQEFDRRLMQCTIDSRGYPEFRA